MGTPEALCMCDLNDCSQQSFYGEKYGICLSGYTGSKWCKIQKVKNRKFRKESMKSTLIKVTDLVKGDN